MIRPAIKISGLSKCFSGKTVLTNIDFTVKTGSVMGILGRNGSGKTTLIKIIMGLLEKDCGEVTVLGLTPVQDHVELMNRIGYVSESRDLYDWMTVGEIVSFCGNIYRCWDNTLAEEQRKRFGLPERTLVSELSFGQRTMLCLLLAVCHMPEVLILDDPSAGLDIPSRSEILSSIIRQAAETGTTVLFSSHIIGEVERVCDHVAILTDCTFSESDSLENLLEKFITMRIGHVEGLLPQELHLIGNCGSDKLCVVAKDQEKQIEIRGRIIERRSSSLEEIYLARLG